MFFFETRCSSGQNVLNHSFVYGCFRHIGLCVLTVWVSIRDPGSIGDRHLLEHGHKNPGIY